MSKFIDAVKAEVLYGYDKLSRQKIPALKITEEINKPLLHNIMRRYSIGVGYKWVLEVRPEDVPFMKDNIIRELRDLVYGDFREKLLKLERAVYEQEYLEAQELIRDLFRETYGD
jgi:hypothetical protein